MPKYSVKKPFTILVAVILVLVLGFVSLTGIQTDLLPAMNLPYLMVITTYPGASPEQVEADVTQPLENALSVLNGVKNVTSQSNENYSLIFLEYQDDTDMDSAMVKASTAVNQLGDALPDMASTPTLMEISPDMMATQYVAVDYDGMDIYELSDYVSENVLPQLERVDGVASVSTTGLVEKSVQITLDQDKIDAVNDKLLVKVSDRLADAKKELDDNKKKINDGLKELDDAQAQLDAGKSELNTQKADVTTQLRDAITELDKQIPELEKKIADLKTDIDDANRKLEDAKNADTTLPEVTLPIDDALFASCKQILAAWDPQYNANELPANLAEAKGSTAKMGAGTNVQDRLVALHDLDCPWRPRDLTQRKGRIERQGNQNKLVHVCRYVTEGTFDAYLWQTVENKQKFISQIMTSKSPVRSCEDVDATALSFAEIKALCAGDPRIKERMDLDIEVSKLKIMKADHNSKQFRLEDSLLKYFPEKIEEHKGFVRGLEADMQTLAAHPLPAEGFVGMEIRGDRLTDKENAGAALLDTCKEVKGKDPVQIGSYRGFTMSVAFDSMWKTYTLTLKGQMAHRVELGSDARGNLVRIENALDKMPERLRSVQEQLENLYNQQAAAKAEVGKPFPQEQELAAKTARLIELDMELNLDGKGQPQPEQAIAKSARPSVLDRLKAPPVHGAPEKPHKKEMEAR